MLNINESHEQNDGTHGIDSTGVVSNSTQPQKFWTKSIKINHSDLVESAAIARGYHQCSIRV